MSSEDAKSLSGAAAGMIGEVECEVADLPRRTKELAIRLLIEGWEKGEDRRHWVIDVRDDAGNIVTVVKLLEAADGTGLVNPH